MRCVIFLISISPRSCWLINTYSCRPRLICLTIAEMENTPRTQVAANGRRKKVSDSAWGSTPSLMDWAFGRRHKRRPKSSHVEIERPIARVDAPTKEKRTPPQLPSRPQPIYNSRYVIPSGPTRGIEDLFRHVEEIGSGAHGRCTVVKHVVSVSTSLFHHIDVVEDLYLSNTRSLGDRFVAIQQMKWPANYLSGIVICLGMIQKRSLTDQNIVHEIFNRHMLIKYLFFRRQKKYMHWKRWSNPTQSKITTGCRGRCTCCHSWDGMLRWVNGSFSTFRGRPEPTGIVCNAVCRTLQAHFTKNGG